MINIQTTVNNFELSESMKVLIEEKLAIPLDKYLSHLPDDQKRAQLHIEKETKTELFKLHFTMNHIFSKTEHIIFESAIVDLREQLEVQIKKIKEQ